MLKKLYALVIAVVVMAVLVTALVAFDIVNQYNDEAAHRYLLSMSQLIKNEIRDGKTVEASAESALKVFSDEEDHLRVTIVDKNGKVIFDNKANIEQMDNHLYRPEIAYAFKNKDVGSAIRSSDTVGEDMLYLAVYDDSEIVIRTAMPIIAHKSGIYNLMTTSLIILFIVALFLAITGSFIVRYVTKPLESLKQAALSMTKGDLSARADVINDKSSETATLSLAFNDMAAKLQQSVEELADRNARLDAILDAITDPVLAVGERCAVTFMNAYARSVFGRDLDPDKAVYPLVLITHSQETEQLAEKAMAEKTIVTAEMALDTETGEQIYHIVASPIRSGLRDGVIITFHDISQAKRVQKMRSDFVANVTHELKTPLTSIRGFIETLKDGAIEKRDIAERFLDIIDIEAERLHKLIDDILILSEIESVRLDKEKEPFDLNALIDDVAVLLDDQAVEHQVSLVLSQEPSELKVTASRHRLKQLLINLVDNAIKYNNEGGKVFVSANRLENGNVEILVRDTGPGIEKEHQERIFERFYRVDKSRSRELGGTGLGLSIVKHIAQLYNGKASLDSIPGEGSTFKVILDI